jgi:hypothetical protein
MADSLNPRMACLPWGILPMPEYGRIDAELLLLDPAGVWQRHGGVWVKQRISSAPFSLHNKRVVKSEADAARRANWRGVSIPNESGPQYFRVDDWP